MDLANFSISFTDTEEIKNTEHAPFGMCASISIQQSKFSEMRLKGICIVNFAGNYQIVFYGVYNNLQVQLPSLRMDNSTVTRAVYYIKHLGFCQFYR